MRVLVAAAIVLVLVGGFIALDTNVLHWWVNQPVASDEDDPSHWAAIYRVAETLCPKHPWWAVERPWVSTGREGERSIVTIRLMGRQGEAWTAVFSVDAAGTVVAEDDGAGRLIASWANRPGCE